MIKMLLFLIINLLDLVLHINEISTLHTCISHVLKWVQSSYVGTEKFKRPRKS